MVSGGARSASESNHRDNVAGYSGTPLDKKLGIKPGQRIALDGVPKDVKVSLASALAECKAVKTAPLDFVLVCSDSRGAVRKAIARWAKLLGPAGMMWLGWPKQKSGIATDLTGNVVRDIGLATGLVDVKVCAISDVWSGLKFVIRVKDRPNP